MKTLLISLALPLGLLLSSCSHVTPDASQPIQGTQFVTVPFSIVVPAPTGTKPLYVSSATKSASISVNSGTPVVVACTSTCSGSVQAPTGSDTFSAKLYDATNGSGNVLSEGTITQTINAGKANTVTISFGGVVKTVTIALAQPQFQSGTAGSTAVSVTGFDASGNAITGTYDSPITLANSDGTGATTLSTTSVTASGQSITFSYNGSVGYTGSTVTASSSGAPVGTFHVPAPLTCYVAPLSDNIHGYQPCDLDSAYNLPYPSNTTVGATKTIALIEGGDNPNAEADLATYRAEFHLSACTTANGCFKKIDVNGGPPPAWTDPTGAWEAESSLDLDMVSAICPNCHIILMENGNGNGDGMQVTAVPVAESLGANIVSMSYGGGDCSNTSVCNGNGDDVFRNANLIGVASSGDTGYDSGNTNGAPSANYPATSPYVVAAGGTTLKQDSSSRGWSETVWNNNTVPPATASATGSGCSLVEPKPSWQHDTGCATKMTNDVSVVGDPSTGVAIYDTNGGSFTNNTKGWMQAGGTSASAPIIAGIYALGGDTNGISAAQDAYSHPQDLYDIVSGSNGVCSPSPSYWCNAGVGYDGPSGMGSPNGLGAFGGATFGMTALSIERRPADTRRVPFYSASNPIHGCTVTVGARKYLCQIKVVLPN